MHPSRSSHRLHAGRGEEADLSGHRGRGISCDCGYPCPDSGKGEIQESFPGGHGRTASLRRPAEGMPGGQGERNPCAGDERHADSPYPGHRALRRSERFHSGRDARGKASHQKLCGGHLLASEGIFLHRGAGPLGPSGLCDLPHGGRGRDGRAGKCTGLCEKAGSGSARRDPYRSSARAYEERAEKSDYGGFCRRKDGRAGFHHGD